MKTIRELKKMIYGALAAQMSASSVADLFGYDVTGDMEYEEAAKFGQAWEQIHTELARKAR